MMIHTQTMRTMRTMRMISRLKIVQMILLKTEMKKMLGSLLKCSLCSFSRTRKTCPTKRF
ncbi:hypothetical protein KC19_VG109300 [Ceratodon purpureus]|uniref:Uncharacterized protein n=1 Tax=Ceratodon purpureus TaxID=3225 RepID=A0A8T0HP86_CERPU|nr:hypothetical protein KC19_VG109300 [Ceratodon purpureus]